jgi:lipid-A-disaccharide synthase
MSGPRIMLVAGEASGDLHAADLVRELRRRAPGLEAFGLGGSQLAAAGAEVVLDLVAHAVIGVTEALRKLGDFARALRLTQELLRTRRPDAVVLVDFPDLNFRIAAQARALGIPVVYYISPQVWAWRRGRIRTLKRLVDRMIVILPFEAPLYERAGIPVTFVGHPLVDIARPETDAAAVRAALLGGAAGPLVALLPGSRGQEVEALLPAMAAAGKLLQAEFPGARCFVPVARTVAAERVAELLEAAGLDAPLVTERPYAARAAADLTLVASGTATLETAILGVPMVIAYRMHPLSYRLARWFVKLPYFGLANLVAGEKAAPELLQDEVTPARLAEAAAVLWREPARAEAQRRAWASVRAKLGGTGAAGRAAEVVLAALRERPPEHLSRGAS